MGNTISKLNIFRLCQDSKTKDIDKKQKEEAKDQPKEKKGNNDSLEVSASDVLLEEKNKNESQIIKDDGYFTAEELEYYRKLYENEQIIHAPLTHIK